VGRQLYTKETLIEIDIWLKQRRKKQWIGNQLGLSQRTFFSHLNALHDANCLKYGKKISDLDLVEHVEKLNVRSKGRVGPIMLQSDLRNLGYIADLGRISAAVRQVDPTSSAVRWNRKKKRRVYSVPGISFDLMNRFNVDCD
jgi:hypothetical protein